MTGTQTTGLILSAVIAYVLGSISFSYIFTKTLRHEDIRTKGSGNAGTTNMLRNYGWKLGLATLACDVLKGVMAALIGLWIAGSNGMFLAAVCCVAGHVFSCFLRFRGGKGIAAATGTLLVIQPLWTIIIFGACVLIVVLTKIMSIGSIIGLIASAAAACLVSGGNLTWDASVIAIALLGLWSHRENIVRLARGQENRLGSFRRS